MLRLALATGAAMAALLPAMAFAQPYSYDPPTPYPDRDSYEQQQSRSANDYARDSSDQDADQDADAPSDAREHYTGRVGTAWRDGDGRDCRWREVTHQDVDGYRSFKWITVCRD